MQQKKCMIVRDLLDSYAEELTGDKTTEFIQQHLKECTKCRDAYQELLEEQEEQRAKESGLDKRFLFKLKRYRYQLMGAFLGVVLTILFIVGALFVSIMVGKEKNNTDVYTNQIDAYGEFKDYYGLSELALFPKKDGMGANVEILSYVYDCSGAKLYQECQIYLECRYDGEGFEKEKSRLQQIENSETGLSVVIDATGYEYPAIYAMKNEESCNEYALLLEEEKKIIYIYLQGSVDRRDLYFDEIYLPYDYGQDGLHFEDVEEYSIYPKETW